MIELVTAKKDKKIAIFIINLNFKLNIFKKLLKLLQDPQVQ